MSNPLDHQLLTETGYGVQFRGGAWTECFVSNASEQWLGKGSSEAEAFDDVLRQMLPSTPGAGALR